MSQYYYYNKVLAQLSAIFYQCGLPRDDDGISNYLCGVLFYNRNYRIDLDALDAYNDYVSAGSFCDSCFTFKEMFSISLKRSQRSKDDKSL
jgi:hypothetical protein